MVKGRSALRQLFAQFFSFALLWVAGALAFVAGLAELGVAIFGVIVLIAGHHCQAGRPRNSRRHRCRGGRRRGSQWRNGPIFGNTDDDDDYSTYYRQGVDEGGSLVTVDVDENAVTEVKSILHDHGAKRVELHGETGWVR